jgi:hypothetical protein
MYTIHENPIEVRVLLKIGDPQKHVIAYGYASPPPPHAFEALKSYSSNPNSVHV